MSIVKIIMYVVIIVGAFFSYRKIITEHILLKKVIEGRKKRKELGTVDLDQYISEQKYHKGKEWLGQKNKGKHPCDLKKPIVMRNYTDGCNYIVPYKGM